ncbi:MAG: DUF1565 domain-containing protein [Clostridiales bacterium]|nr:DUF1565 domain-containing protein [Clostridiales bacterium]
MQTTPNLGLKKPESNEYVNVADINENADTIDSAIGKITPLDADMTVYVATTGSNTTGDGTSSKPYKTITYALSTIPKNLGDHTATINVADGTYAEDVKASGFYAGFLTICSNVENSFNANCVVQSLAVWTCFANVKLQGLTVAEETNKNAIHIVNSHTVDIFYIRSLKENPTTSCVVCVKSYVNIAYCELLNHLRAVYATEGSTVFLDNSTVGDILNLAGSIVTSRNSSFIGSTVVNPGGVLVSPYGAKIGTLSTDVTLYVATTGSDLTGDGTSGNPYRTIKRALDIVPKDLGGSACTITVASGTYNEDVHIYGFHNGAIDLYSDTAGTLSSSCNLLSISITYCTGYVRINGFNLTSNTKPSILVGATDGAYIYYCQSIHSAPSVDGVQCYESKASLQTCKITGKNRAVMASFSTVRSENWYTSGGNAYGIYSINGSRVITIGVQPSGINENFPVGNGGMFVNNNGTQISEVISSGLSCTWGTIRGGYIRHGNSTGTAMITIQVNVYTSTVLSVGSNYEIAGFPLPSSPYDIAVATNRPSLFDHTHFRASLGRLSVSPTTNFNAGQSIIFNCTYLTNS